MISRALDQSQKQPGVTARAAGRDGAGTVVVIFVIWPSSGGSHRPPLSFASGEGDDDCDSEPAQRVLLEP